MKLVMLAAIGGFFGFLLGFFTVILMREPKQPEPVPSAPVDFTAETTGTVYGMACLDVVDASGQTIDPTREQIKAGECPESPLPVRMCSSDIAWMLPIPGPWVAPCGPGYSGEIADKDQAFWRASYERVKSREQP